MSLKRRKSVTSAQVLDRVFFDYHGERKEGTITRLNQKTVTVTLDNGAYWNVSPDFLKKIEGENTLSELSSRGNLTRTKNQKIFAS